MSVFTITRKTGNTKISSLLKRMKALDGASVSAGFLSGSVHAGRAYRYSQDNNSVLEGTESTTSASVASFLEYGGFWTAMLRIRAGNRIIFKTVRVPARPFMRDTVNNNRQNWIESFKAVVSGTKKLSSIGVEMKRDIKKQMLSGDYAPNGGFWNQFKQGTTPLVDTGNLLASVAYRVDGGKN